MNASRDTIGVLFLGCGAAARMHSRTLRHIRGVELSYASRDPVRAESCRRAFGGRRAFGSYDGGLADPSVTVAIVATPTAFHRELAVNALRAGKHVIIEKPAFMRSTDADVVRQIACATSRSVFVAENYAYKPIAAHLRRVIEAGDLGDVRFVSINATKRQRVRGWRSDAALSGGGALFEGGVHWVSFAANIGLEVEHAMVQRADGVDGQERSSLVVFRYANGAIGTLAHSWELAAPFGGLRLSKVQGTLGAVTFESNGMLAVTTGRRRSVKLFAHRDPLGYRGMFVDFLHALRTGEPPQFTLAMAQRDLRLLE
ncbi:MAG TPA: Gfo/Idh/MocA family oxidoreductase [Gemmatimonadaceae bacterium]|nr:Gfo/Idh/MocA family oxidoreductase [Gemmatimonadaceae bacterium]